MPYIIMQDAFQQAHLKNKHNAYPPPQRHSHKRDNERLAKRGQCKYLLICSLLSTLSTTCNSSSTDTAVHQSALRILVAPFSRSADTVVPHWP